MELKTFRHPMQVGYLGLRRIKFPWSRNRLPLGAIPATSLADVSAGRVFLL